MGVLSSIHPEVKPTRDFSAGRRRGGPHGLPSSSCNSLPQLSHVRHDTFTGLSSRMHVTPKGPPWLWSVGLNHLTNGAPSIVQIHPSACPGLGPYLTGENLGA